MCYSAKLRQDYRELSRRYFGKLSWDEFMVLVRQRERGYEFDLDMKIPDGLIAGLIDMGGTAAKEIELMQRRFKVAERKGLEEALVTAKAELQAAADKLVLKSTKTNQNAVEVKGRKALKAQKALDAPAVADDGSYRIYPNYFSPILIQEGGQRLIVPARYRILPRTGVELPATYNVFNARRDSLQHRQTWKPLFGNKHALFPFIRFYEWVDRAGSKVEISFNPDGHDGMHSAALYDEFMHGDLGRIRSFAMVTDEPPPEVAAAGHDRCPVFLDESLVDDWLTPAGKSWEQLDALLDHKQPTYYSHAAARAA